MLNAQLPVAEAAAVQVLTDAAANSGDANRIAALLQELRAVAVALAAKAVVLALQSAGERAELVSLPAVQVAIKASRVSVPTAAALLPPSLTVASYGAVMRLLTRACGTLALALASIRRAAAAEAASAAAATRDSIAASAASTAEVAATAEALAWYSEPVPLTLIASDTEDAAVDRTPFLPSRSPTLVPSSSVASQRNPVGLVQLLADAMLAPGGPAVSPAAVAAALEDAAAVTGDSIVRVRRQLLVLLRERLGPVTAARVASSHGLEASDTLSNGRPEFDLPPPPVAAPTESLGDLHTPTAPELSSDPAPMPSSVADVTGPVVAPPTPPIPSVAVETSAAALSGGGAAIPAMCSVAQAAALMGCESADIEFLLSTGQIASRRMGSFVRVHSETLRSLPVTRLSDVLRRFCPAAGFPVLPEPELLRLGLLGAGVPPPRHFSWCGALSVTIRDMDAALAAAGGALVFSPGTVDIDSLAVGAAATPPLPANCASLESISAAVAIPTDDLAYIVAQGLLDTALVDSTGAGESSPSAVGPLFHVERAVAAIDAALVSLSAAGERYFDVVPGDASGLAEVAAAAADAGVRTIEYRGSPHFVVADLLRTMVDVGACQ